MMILDINILAVSSLIFSLVITCFYNFFFLLLDMQFILNLMSLISYHILYFLFYKWRIFSSNKDSLFFRWWNLNLALWPLWFLVTPLSGGTGFSLKRRSLSNIVCTFYWLLSSFSWWFWLLMSSFMCFIYLRWHSILFHSE